MKTIHAQLYDGGWLVKIEHNSHIFTGTGGSLEAAENQAERFAREAAEKVDEEE